MQDAKPSFGGSLSWKNILGYGESWDATCSYDFDGGSDLIAGFHLPRLSHWPSNLATRVVIRIPEWLNLASYKVHSSGVTIGFSHSFHDLSCNLTWNLLHDDDGLDVFEMLPALKYSFKLDHRDSITRAIRGYAFKFAAKIVGDGSKFSDYSTCQDVDFRAAIPLGSSLNAALNIGLSGGIMLPWARNYCQTPLFSNCHLYIGKHSLLLNEMNGPTTILRLISKGLGKFSHTQNVDNVGTEGNQTIFKGNIAATAFADLSFDFPWRSINKYNAYGHCFVCVANAADPRNNQRSLSGHLRNFLSLMKGFVGAGIVFPTRYFNLEVNICQMLGHGNEGKRGVQIGFSSPG
ncbi:hypothetical protein KP509_1Z061400 [Ceratopteris richardii]|nr:hypothetical protein KP509_1Z061400 [Ceratopteris richardii]